MSRADYQRFDILNTIRNDISYDDGAEVSERLEQFTHTLKDRIGLVEVTEAEASVLEEWRQVLTARSLEAKP